MRGIVDWKLGLDLGIAFFAGAVVGAAFARRMSSRLLRGVFLIVVFVLAAKTLLYDVRW